MDWFETYQLAKATAVSQGVISVKRTCVKNQRKNLFRPDFSPQEALSGKLKATCPAVFSENQTNLRNTSKLNAIVKTDDDLGLLDKGYQHCYTLDLPIVYSAQPQ